MSPKHNTKKIIRRVILIAAAAVILLSAVIIGMCLFNQRPAVQTAEAYRDAFGTVTITVAEDGGVEILPPDGADKQTGIVFYVGAQIRPSAYIPLLARLADEGYACFIPDLTFNMAALEPKAADDVIAAHPDVRSWYVAGHSMGGLTASGYADDHREGVDGLILLAAYVNRDMSDAALPTLAVYGDADGVMNKSLYDKRMGWNTSDFEEHIISGANHAQFGDYGIQPRDSEAKISADDQQTQTAAVILDWLARHGTDGRN